MKEDRIHISDDILCKLHNNFFPSLSYLFLPPFPLPLPLIPSPHPPYLPLYLPPSLPLSFSSSTLPHSLHPPSLSSAVTGVVTRVPQWGAAAATVLPTTTSCVPVATAAGSSVTRRCTANITSPMPPMR